MNWNKYYMDQSGHGSDYSIYRGAYQQRGYGLGGAFRRFFKWIVPVFQQHALPVLESGAKTVGKEALNSISNIVKDVSAGKNVKESAQEHFNSAMDNLKEKAENALAGRGIKRKRKSNKKQFIILKRKNQDIFS
jgi:hypothetical protein